MTTKKVMMEIPAILGVRDLASIPAQGAFTANSPEFKTVTSMSPPPENATRAQDTDTTSFLTASITGAPSRWLKMVSNV